MSRSSQKDTVRTYDEWYREPSAPHWEDAPGKSILVAAIKRCTASGSPLRVLDIGCGTGSFLERLRQEVSKCWKYSGLDISEVAIELGGQRYPQLRLAVDDATEIKAGPGSFDIVTCYGSWEHFPQPEAAIREASRVLSPGGWLFAMIPALGIHRTDRDDEGWYEDTEVDGCEKLQFQWNLRRETWAAMFLRAGILLKDDSLSASCGAIKPGVFFFGARTEEQAPGLRA